MRVRTVDIWEYQVFEIRTGVCPPPPLCDCRRRPTRRLIVDIGASVWRERNVSNNNVVRCGRLATRLPPPGIGRPEGVAPSPFRRHRDRTRVGVRDRPPIDWRGTYFRCTRVLVAGRITFYLVLVFTRVC